MSSTGSTADLGPAQERLLAESRAQLELGLVDRERTVEMAAAFAFVLAAAVIALAWDSPRALDVPLAVGLVAAYALATRVEFRIASGWTDPSQLVFRRTRFRSR